MATSDGTKIAASIMAAEASRQQQALKTGAAGGQGYDIAGGIFGYYVSFLAKIVKQERDHPRD